MDKIVLDGFWLLGGLGVAYLLGVFTAQKLKDTINGVPSALRTALSATEASALAELSKAKAALVADVGKLFTKAATATAAAATPVAVAPVVATVVAKPAV